MTPSQDASQQSIRSPAPTDLESSITLPKRRLQSPSSSLASLPYRRSNPSLTSLFASTSSLSGSRPGSGTSTPTASTVPGSVFSPGPRANGASTPLSGGQNQFDDLRNLIARSFAPHVGVLASEDTEELIQQKGFPGGLLELIRPFGENITGKLAVRDSVGASRVVDDFGIRFTGLKDGLGFPSFPRKSGESSRNSIASPRGSAEKKPERWSRTGGNISHIEEAVDRHISYSELQNASSVSDYINSNSETFFDKSNVSVLLIVFEKAFVGSSDDTS